ncbi:DUF3185 domain-containing protein [Terriglobus sp.]|uniref:DUF3185 domain-containing protein n=1 Tax=Terriglobus sp. TaxID=1889013 RepID=UPI003B009371
MRIIPLVLGTLLLAVGIFGLLTGGISFTHRKDVVNTGSVHITRESTSHLPLAPVLSVLAIAAGAGCIFAGMRTR